MKKRVFAGSAERPYRLRKRLATEFALPWKEFGRLSAATFKGKPLVDCWRVLSKARETAKRCVNIGALDRERAQAVRQPIS